MMKTVAWKRLQEAIEDHCKNVQQTLAAHTSTMGRKNQGLVKSLEDAGFRYARETQHGMWVVSLALPNLYTPGDNAPFNITMEGHWRKSTVRDLQTMSTTTSPRT